MILAIGSISALVRIRMSVPEGPGSDGATSDISPWEREAYGQGGRFGALSAVPMGDPAKDRITVDFTGCAYRVARRLAAEGHKVAFLSLLGGDPLGMAARKDLEEAGVDTSLMIREEDGLTPICVEAKNFLGDVEFQRKDERLMERFRPALLEQGLGSLEEAALVFADGSLPRETLTALGELCRDRKKDLYFDPAGREGAARGQEILTSCRGIMPGRIEAEILSGLEILSEEQLSQAGDFFLEQGIDKTVITLKGGGLYYRDRQREGVLRPERKIRYGETSGAGDVVSAALLSGYRKGEDLETSGRKAMKAAEVFLADVVDERPY